MIMAENVRGQNRNMHEDAQQQDQQLNNRGSERNDHQNASANQGGVSDMRGKQGSGSTRGSSRAGSGSDLAAKQSITGSDYDGQPAE